jgi:deoxyribodipyrimidine photolyase-related protein
LFVKNLWSGEKNGKKTGMKSNTVLKGVEKIKKIMHKAAFVFGDQLTLDNEIFKDDKSIPIILIESINECTKIINNKNRLVFFISSMRDFRDLLISNGYKVKYYELGYFKKDISLIQSLFNALKKLKINALAVQKPGDFELYASLVDSAKKNKINLTVSTSIYDYLPPKFFDNWSDNKKKLLMEFFYRKVRIEKKILVDNSSKPIGGKWNYDFLNREGYKKSQKLNVPCFHKNKNSKNTLDVIERVDEIFSDSPGNTENFFYATNVNDAKESLEAFIDSKLESFGRYQDLMLDDQAFLFHAIISPYLNASILSPEYVINRILQVYENKKLPINSIEGFIRQIIGWREFMKGVYWKRMPDLISENFFEINNKLPEFYWNAKTKMSCLKAVITQVLEYGYAHHIQRLMILGNFALLSETNPKEIHLWFLGMFIDAVEWVEMPNVIGMSQFSEGGFFTSKPYISSGQYINKMSNYCQKCKYKIKTDNIDELCPFTILYWRFLHNHKSKLKNNPRMTMAFRNLEKNKKIKSYIQKGNKILSNINHL